MHPELSGVEVEVSSRRKTTAVGRWEDFTFKVSVPPDLSHEQLTQVVHDLKLKLSISTTQGLELLSAQLVKSLFPELKNVHFKANWVDMNPWGTCQDDNISISSKLKVVPPWVLKAVLVHELAHLLEPNHGPHFKELLKRYPSYPLAVAFLSGFSLGLKQ